MGIFEDLYALTEQDWDKVSCSSFLPLIFLSGYKMTNSAQCWAVNVKANLHLLRAALPTFNVNPEGGSMLITSSVAVSSASPFIRF